LRPRKGEHDAVMALAARSSVANLDPLRRTMVENAKRLPLIRQARKAATPSADRFNITPVLADDDFRSAGDAIARESVTAAVHMGAQGGKGNSNL
jgi:hypothetical protein